MPEIMNGLVFRLKYLFPLPMYRLALPVKQTTLPTSMHDLTDCQCSGLGSESGRKTARYRRAGELSYPWVYEHSGVRIWFLRSSRAAFTYSYPIGYFWAPLAVGHGREHGISLAHAPFREGFRSVSEVCSLTWISIPLFFLHSSRVIVDLDLVPLRFCVIRVPGGVDRYADPSSLAAAVVLCKIYKDRRWWPEMSHSLQAYIS